MSNDEVVHSDIYIVITYEFFPSNVNQNSDKNICALIVPTILVDVNEYFAILLEQ